MGLFGFLKKKQAEPDIELPPPPRPPEAATVMPYDAEIPPIRAGMPLGEEEEMPPVGLMPPQEMMGLPEREDTPEEMHIPEGYEMPSEEPEETPLKVYNRTIEEFAPRREEVIFSKEVKPMFVAVDEYKNLASNTKLIRAKLLEAEDHVSRLGDLKNEKEKIFDKWRKLLEETEKKLSYVDGVIEKAQG